MPKKKILGVFPPMITPFTKNDDVDYEAHANNVKRWNDCGLGGFLVLGSNSETVYLTEKEKLRLVEVTVESATSEHLIMAGTGMESTRETIHLTNESAKCGAQAALVVTPFYYKAQMTQTALIQHYQHIADTASIPILIYNVTKYTGINMSPEAIGVLSEHPNIIGMKDSSGNIPQLIQYQKAAKKDFNILVGTASAWYPGQTLGVQAAIMALANCAPKECVAVQSLFQAGRFHEAEALYRKLFPVNLAVTATYGIAGLKYAVGLRGYSGGYVRSPLSELNSKEKEEITNILREAGLIT